MTDGKCPQCGCPTYVGWDIHAETFCTNLNCSNPPSEDKNYIPPEFRGNPIPGYIGGDDDDY
jgi:hypothetical protein